jgi:hypothetical protein
MKKLFYLMFAALAFMACNNNEPESKQQQSTDPKPDGTSFQFVVKNLTTDEANILVVPPTAQTEFFWAYATEKYLNEHYPTLSQFVQSYFTANTYDTWKSAGRILGGTKKVNISSLKDNTDYRLVVCQIDHDLNIIGNPASYKFKTVRFIPEGLLSGVFTVDNNGKKVGFSQGNLQYQASTQIWRFAEHQYDTIGALNENISDTYSDWIDLFGWNTADKPTLATKTNADYSAGEFTDWGDNPISNGGNTAEQWRTLTKAEWLYLFKGRTDADKLFGLGCIYFNTEKTKWINGIFIIPDDWTCPEGAHFTPSTQVTDEELGKLEWTAYELPAYENEKSGNFKHNVYTLNEWKTLAESGVVFLPAAGNRNGTKVDEVGAWGIYWSSTYSGSVYTAYPDCGGAISFNSGKFYMDANYPFRYAYSVRLVQDVK